jgi:FK506-binding protein 2
MGIDGVEAPVSIIEKSKSKASDTASKVADSATEGVKNAAASAISKAAEAAATILADTDGDGQEHNEL